MEDKLYWLWFTLKNISPKTQIKLLERLGTPCEIYKTDDYDKALVPAEYGKLLKDKSLSNAERVLNRTEKWGGYILTYSDAEYPDTLRQIPVPPLVLYCMGCHVDWNNSFKITVVGTRKYSKYGRSATTKIVRELAEYDTLIVTGMARGIDAIANCAALRAGGRTAAVLGSGIDVIYPPEYTGLYNAITRSGVVITEFPPGTPPLKQNFPRRNRIMAGIAEGVLIGQAPIKSGSLITAAYAIDNGVQTFAIPSRIDDEDFAGSHALISQGTKLVTCAEDITETFPYLTFTKKIPKKEPEQKPEKESEHKHEKKSVPEQKLKKEKKTVTLEGLSDTEKKLAEFLCESDLHVDDLARMAGMSSPETNSTLVMMELSGIVKKLKGNIYSIA